MRDDEGTVAGEGRDDVPLQPPAVREVMSTVGTRTVDGETFTVRRRDADGSFHYDWISGPNRGYGFSVSGGGTPPSPGQHAARIRGFLASVDPETGYL